MRSDCIAIIPARGRSQAVPRKNFRWLNGKPLLAYSIEAAINSAIFNEVYVTSDDDDLLSIARKWKAIPLHRPARLSGDRVPLDPVIEDALRQAFKLRRSLPINCASIQPTSPLLKASTIKMAYREFCRQPVDTLFCAYNDTHLAWEIKGARWLPLYHKRLNRQQLLPRYKETGGAVFFKSAQLLDFHTRFGKQAAGFEITRIEALDIDSLEDLAFANALIKGRRRVAFVCAGDPQKALHYAERLGAVQPYFFVMHPNLEAQRALRRFRYPYQELSPAMNTVDIERVRRFAPHEIFSNIVNRAAKQKLKACAPLKTWPQH